MWGVRRSARGVRFEILFVCLILAYPIGSAKVYTPPFTYAGTEETESTGDAFTVHGFSNAEGKILLHGQSPPGVENSFLAVGWMGGFVATNNDPRLPASLSVPVSFSGFIQGRTDCPTLAGWGAAAVSVDLRFSFYEFRAADDVPLLDGAQSFATSDCDRQFNQFVDASDVWVFGRGKQYLVLVDAAIAAVSSGFGAGVVRFGTDTGFFRVDRITVENIPPVVALTSGDQQVSMGQNFNDGVRLAGYACDWEAAIIDAWIDAGDGTIYTAPTGVCAEHDLRHTYSASGTYIAKFCGRDLEFEENCDSRTVNVLPDANPPEIQFIEPRPGNFYRYFGVGDENSPTCQVWAVTVVYPLPGFTDRGCVQLAVTDNQGVSAVEVRLNGALVGNAFTNLGGEWVLNFPTPTPNPASLLEITAYDFAGNTRTVTMPVTVTGVWPT